MLPGRLSLSPRDRTLSQCPMPVVREKKDQGTQLLVETLTCSMSNNIISQYSMLSIKIFPDRLRFQEEVWWCGMDNPICTLEEEQVLWHENIWPPDLICPAFLLLSIAYLFGQKADQLLKFGPYHRLVSEMKYQQWSGSIGRHVISICGEFYGIGEPR